MNSNKKRSQSSQKALSAISHVEPSVLNHEESAIKLEISPKPSIPKVDPHNTQFSSQNLGNLGSSPVHNQNSIVNQSISRKFSEPEIQNPSESQFGKYFNKELSRTKKKLKVSNLLMNGVFDELKGVNKKGKNSEEISKITK